MVDIEATPDETKKITGANVKAQVLAGHKDLTTGVHGVGSNHVALAPTTPHLVRTFTKGWTVDKLLKGAGADVDPTEEGMNQSCRAEHLAAQSIPNTTWTTLSLSSEVWDTNDIHDNATNNSRLTCKVAGYYFPIGFVQWAANATGRRLIRILKNGTTAMSQAEFVARSDGAASCFTLSLINLAVNDYIELQVYQSSGAALDTYYVADDIPTNFTMHRLVT